MTNILLLNATYEPLAVITQRRALALLMKERVQIASEEAIEIKGVSTTLKIPAVLRLRRYVNVPQRGVRWTRRGVLQRDNYTCAYCGIQPGAKQRGNVLAKHSFTIDHIVPVSRGGRNTWGNTICACPQCNQRKGNRTPHEANMKLLWEPKTPRISYWVASGKIPSAWKVYLPI